MNVDIYSTLPVFICTDTYSMSISLSRLVNTTTLAFGVAKLSKKRVLETRHPYVRISGAHNFHRNNIEITVITKIV